MSAFGLEELGICSWKEIRANLSFDELYEQELDPRNQGFEKGYLTEFGAVSVDTGLFTGRSAKDKYIVKESSSSDHIWWAGTGSDNQPISEETWSHLKNISTQQLTDKVLYVMDGYCGTNKDTRIAIRLVTEVAWMAHFVKNMFIRPTEEELKTFIPDWTILNACKTSCTNYKQYGLRSEVFAAFNIKERMTCIGGTWYGGEMKKGIFSMMNYFLPLKDIASLHCSANVGDTGKDTALFFGLSGTGKTTLSADPGRRLIGDDEHGWDKDGIFNFEGGCYAKMIDLSQKKEPEIWNAIKKDALLENVDIAPNGKVDYASAKKTENTRASYPIYHIDNIVKPVSKAGHAQYIIFLTCDAYGVLPPIAKLSEEQAMYQYISGYTAKVAGTELGITEPKATFSACFGAAFLTLHPMKYAELLGQKMRAHQAKAYLVNTGWSGGKYGIGNRMSLNFTRKLIDYIFDGTLENAAYTSFPIFNFVVPIALPEIDSTLLNPRNTWADKADYDRTLEMLANKFITNFKPFTDFEAAKKLEAFGPKI